eukprot:NODE_4575_length_1874_cov_4.127075.p1 GENE.NODE_4575_length_1874_cov_4.127075~~NODE_4575_length_1874_cov_4.127075.p1  ORF type:complete len:501 (+),score=150.47 NODE_4575_length_1874_cov_4.127075:126-1628(+)
MQWAPTFAFVLYSSTAIVLAILSAIGVPWTLQSLGALIFFSAFPFLWLNERREARMVQLLQKAVSKLVVFDSDHMASYYEGKLVYVVGNILNGRGGGLSLPQWGVEPPDLSIAVCARVEMYRPFTRWSWRRFLCCCQRGEWREGGDVPVMCSAKWSPHVRLSVFRLQAKLLESLDLWEPLMPRSTKRFEDVKAGEENALFAGVKHTLGLGEALPLPGEVPLVAGNGSVLYYRKGGGKPEDPRLGDLRVSFLHIPFSADRVCTTLGVVHDGTLHAFQYRKPPPSGISLGSSSTKDFNLGDGSVPTAVQDGGLTTTDDEAGALLGHAAKATGANPAATQAASFALNGMLEGWRRVFDSTVPEVLLCVLPGSITRAGFFLRAYRDECLLTWRLRVFGYLLMVSGLETTFWHYFFDLSILGGMFVSAALWTVTLIASCGFTMLTVSVAAAFYRPIYSLLWFAASVATFLALFGVVPLLVALACVGACMAIVTGMLALHLVLPCC